MNITFSFIDMNIMLGGGRVGIEQNPQIIPSPAICILIHSMNY